MRVPRLQRWFPVKEQLTDAEVQAGLRYILRDGMAGQAMASLTGSAFLTALALHLGAPNTVIGLLAAIPQLAQLIQLPTVTLVRQVGNRRAIAVVASLIGRSVWLVIALGLLVLGDTESLTLLVAGVLVASVMAGIANCGWNSWIHDLVPQHTLGEFFGKRFSLATLMGVIVSFSAAAFIDHLAPQWLASVPAAYAVIFLVGFGCGLLGVAFMARIPEPRMHVDDTPLLQVLTQPFREENFRNLLRFLAAWNFAFYLATPFFTVYMLKRLEMDLSWVIGLIILGRLVNIMFLRIWGGLADGVSHKTVLAVSGPLCLLCILGWTFTTLPDKYVLTFPLLVLLHILMGIAMAGITLSIGNIGLKLAPRGQGTNYLASVNFVGAISAGIAPILGGPLVDFFETRQLSWTLRWISPDGALELEALNLQHWDFLFVLSALLGLYALHRLSLVREVGEVEERVLVLELMTAIGREVRDFSSVAPIRYIRSMTGQALDVIGVSPPAWEKGGPPQKLPRKKKPPTREQPLDEP